MMKITYIKTVHEEEILYDAGMTEERAKGILNAIDNDRFLIRVNFIRENKGNIQSR